MTLHGDALIEDYINGWPEPVGTLQMFLSDEGVRQAIANYLAVVAQYGNRNWDGQQDGYLIIEVALYEIGHAVCSALELPTTADTIEAARHAHAKERLVQASHVRRERARVSAAVKLAVFKRDGYRCMQCGSQEELEVDHIVPVSAGGTSARDNLQTLCHNCNSAKGSTVG